MLTNFVSYSGKWAVESVVKLTKICLRLLKGFRNEFSLTIHFFKFVPFLQTFVYHFKQFLPATLVLYAKIRD